MPYPVVGHNDAAVGLLVSRFLARTIALNISVVRARLVARIVPIFDYANAICHTYLDNLAISKIAKMPMKLSWPNEFT